MLCPGPLQVDAASAASVKPLVLFLGQYLLCQQHFDDELNQVCRVFAPLLFSAAGVGEGGCSSAYPHQQDRGY